MNTVLDFSEIKLAENFDPASKDFNAYNMAYLTYCAKSVYESDKSCQQQLRELDPKITKQIKFFHAASSGTEAFIAHDQQKIIISFRGTSSKQDFLTDAKSMQTTWTFSKKIGKVHSGFYSSLNSICSEIKEHINRIRQGKPANLDYWT